MRACVLCGCAGMGYAVVCAQLVFHVSKRQHLLGGIQARIKQRQSAISYKAILTSMRW
jgi:hypothetical protein